MKLTNYKVTLDLWVNHDECGHPETWDWQLLLDLGPMEELRGVSVETGEEVEVFDETEEDE